MRAQHAAGDAMDVSKRTVSGKHRRTTILASAIAALTCALAMDTAMQLARMPAQLPVAGDALATDDIVTTPLENAVFTSVPTAGIPNLEVSLVIDLSDPTSPGRKLARVKQAARQFVDEVLGETAEGNVSVSLVPYAGHVNLGRDMFGALERVRQIHGFSYCVDLPDSAYATPSLPTNGGLAQMQHVTWDNTGLVGPSRASCPQRDFEQVVAFSRDADLLNDRISRLKPHAEAALFQGVKWGSTLLDPSSRPIVQSLADLGRVEDVFANRPAAHEDGATHKALVLIGDGRNDDSLRVAEWAYNSPSEYVHWARHSFWPYLERSVQKDDHSDYFEMRYPAQRADDLTRAACAAAKDRGIEIWAIAIGDASNGAGLLADCASSPDHLILAPESEIDTAVAAVAELMHASHLLR